MTTASRCSFRVTVTMAERGRQDPAFSMRAVFETVGKRKATRVVRQTVALSTA